MQALKVQVKITSVSNPSMAARCPNGDLPMIIGFLGIRRRPAGAPAVTAGPPVDRRPAIAPKFLSSAKWIRRSPNSRLAVAARRPVHDFYDMVQGRKNLAMICRCQKTGIGGKSGDHRTIYKACDVGIIWVSVMSEKDEYIPSWKCWIFTTI